MVNCHKVALEEQRERADRGAAFSKRHSREQKIHEERTKSLHEACRTRTHESSQQAETRGEQLAASICTQRPLCSTKRTSRGTTANRCTCKRAALPWRVSDSTEKQ